jgi:N-acetylglucosaminyl-diphospho-decaprenol L-rhamnosyltransferase
MPEIDVSLIIISLNSRRFLTDCLVSIKNSIWRKTTYEIIVVDNGSTDGTLDILASEHHDVQVIANRSNVGFCKAGNQGSEISRGRYVMFLNDDILILDDAFPLLIEFMDAHSNVGMVGSRLLNIDGTDQFSSGRAFPSPLNAVFGRKSVLTRLFPNAPPARRYLLSPQVLGTEPYEVDWLSAAAMLIRREAFYEVKGLAEDFYYFHEMIICDRVQRAGHTVYLHPLSKILHYEGAGSGVRTRRIRTAHVKRFHIAAYRWFCLHHRISKHNPVRLLIGGALAVRAGFLIAVETMRAETEATTKEIRIGRPEGGIPQ